MLLYKAIPQASLILVLLRFPGPCTPDTRTAISALGKLSGNAGLPLANTGTTFVSLSGDLAGSATVPGPRRCGSGAIGVLRATSDFTPAGRPSIGRRSPDLHLHRRIRGNCMLWDPDCRHHGPRRGRPSDAGGMGSYLGRFLFRF